MSDYPCDPSQYDNDPDPLGTFWSNDKNGISKNGEVINDGFGQYIANFPVESSLRDVWFDNTSVVKFANNLITGIGKTIYMLDTINKKILFPNILMWFIRIIMQGLITNEGANMKILDAVDYCLGIIKDGIINNSYYNGYFNFPIYYQPNQLKFYIYMLSSVSNLTRSNNIDSINQIINKYNSFIATLKHSDTPSTSLITLVPPISNIPMISPSIIISQYAAPSITPSVTESVTPFITPSIKPYMTQSITPSITPTMMPTPSITPTMMPTPSITPTMMPTPSIMPSMTPSIAPTITPSITPYVTPSITPTITPSITPSITPTITPSITPTITPSITPTITPSITPTITPSITPTITPSVTPSITPTITPSVTPSITPTITPSITPTITPSIAPTITPSITPYVIPSITPSVTKNPSTYITSDQVILMTKNYMYQNYITIGITISFCFMVLFLFIVFLLWKR